MKRVVQIVAVAATAFALGLLLSRVLMMVPARQPAPQPAPQPASNAAPAPSPPVALSPPAAPPATTVSAATAQARGEDQFIRACAGCHTIGGGDKTGPDLSGIVNRRPREWLTRMITEPDRLRLEKDETALQLFEKYNRFPMPNLGLGKAEAGDILEFIERRSR